MNERDCAHELFNTTSTLLDISNEIAHYQLRINPVKFNTLLSLLASLSVTSFSLMAQPIELYAAGSLKSALNDVTSLYQQQYQTPVTSKYGPSGLLRKEIETGASATVFTSANIKHPLTLQKANWGGPVVLFARNQLCAIAQPEVVVTSDTLLEMILDKNIKLGTSTPKADPSGDYAWKLFEKAELLISGSYQQLSDKALQLTGGPNSPKAPTGLNQYAWVMVEKQADIFLTYCTNAIQVKRLVPELQIIQLPQTLAVGADYGLIVKGNADTPSWQLAMYILSPKGQKILQNYGFVTNIAD